MSPAVATHMVPPTAGETKASAMCMIEPPLLLIRLPAHKKTTSGWGLQPYSYLRGFFKKKRNLIFGPVVGVLPTVAFFSKTI